MKDFKDLIQKYIEQQMDFESFEASWVNMYIDKNLSNNLLESDQDLLEEIHEKIEYTVKDPMEDKQWGYITYQELRDFLKKKMNV